MPAEHDNYEPLIRELEPTDDESIPREIRALLSAGEIMRSQLTELKPSREVSLAKTKLDECLMWIARHHAVNGR